jgi:transcription elongation factor GreB
MSKAFTSEETDLTEVVAPRAPLPPGTPNYVTPRGLSLLREERADLATKRARAEAAGDVAAMNVLAARLAELDARLASAELVDPSAQPKDVVRFGATVTVHGEDSREHAYRIVGVDEAEPKHGDVAFTSPIARALLGHEVGDEVTLRTPRGNETLEILAIA